MTKTVGALEDPCDTKNRSACNKQVIATQTGDFYFCGAMCVPRPLKYTNNGGSIITYRPGQPSIAGRRGSGLSCPLQFFRTDLYDIISSSVRRRPATTVINFHPATGQTTSGKCRHPNPMFTFRYGYGHARLFELKIQVCRFTWFERRIIDGSLHGTIHNQRHPVIACRQTL